MTQDEILDLLINELDADDSPDSNGNYWAECPSCGEERELQKFSFTAYSDSTGGSAYNCFKCNFNHGDGRRDLISLAKFVFGEDFIEKNKRKRRTIKTDRPKPKMRRVAWEGIGEQFIERTRVDMDAVYNAWQGYKPVTKETIDHYKLGIGRLPYLNEHGARVFMYDYRLTVPQFSQSKIIGLYGRKIGGSGWINSTGTQLGVMFGLEDLRGGKRTLWIVENKVDMMLFRQGNDEDDIVAVQTARKLRPGEVRHIVNLKYEYVCVCLDNDLAGQAQGELYEKLRREKMQKMQRSNPGRRPTLKKRAGNEIHDQLKRWVTCKLFDWNEYGAPEGADMGWLLTESGVV